MQTTQIWDKHSAHSLSAAIHFTRQVMLPDTVRINFTCIMHTHIDIYLHTYLPTYFIFYTCTSSRRHIFDQLGDSYSKMIPVHPNLPNSERLHSVISLSTFVAVNRDAALQSCWREAQVCLSSARAPWWGQQWKAEGHKPLRQKMETWSHSNQLSMATILLLSCIHVCAYAMMQPLEHSESSGTNLKNLCCRSRDWVLWLPSQVINTLWWLIVPSPLVWESFKICNRKAKWHELLVQSLSCFLCGLVWCEKGKAPRPSRSLAWNDYRETDCCILVARKKFLRS